MGFVFQGVDGIDDVVVTVEVELLGGLLREYLLQRCDVGHGIDGEQTLAEGFHLHLADGLGGGHQLAVDVGDAYTVAVDEGEVADAAAHQALGAPRAYAAHAEDDDAHVADTLHRLFAQQQLRAPEYSFV